MGQRTQIIVIKENNKGEVRKTVWHHQWGFGRIMYLALMSLYIGDYNKDTWAEGYDFFNTSFPLIPKLINVTDEIPKDILGQANVDNLASIRRVIDYCDNNNGAMVVYIKENPTENYLTSQFKVGFLMGLEDEYYTSTYDNKTYNKRNIGEKPFSRWLTPVEYGRINGGNKYSDENFTEMVYKFCEYFEIETLKEDKSVEEDKKESQETNDGDTDKTDSADDSNSSDEEGKAVTDFHKQWEVIENNIRTALDKKPSDCDKKLSNNEEIYATEDVLGRRLITRIQMGLFDVADGEISEIKVVDGQIYFHWNFYDGGWYTRDGLLREEARKLIDGITDQEILIGINRCKNGKK